jgi:hypothetical protein
MPHFKLIHERTWLQSLPGVATTLEQGLVRVALDGEVLFVRLPVGFIHVDVPTPLETIRMAARRI